MRTEKLGLDTFLEEDESLHQELSKLMQQLEVDMTIFYRRLSDVSVTSLKAENDALLAPIMEAFYAPDALTQQDKQAMADWMRLYLVRVEQTAIADDVRKTRMNQVNPKYVLRNYLSQQAIELAEQGDYSRVSELLEVMRRPYDEQPEYEHYAVKRPDWARSKPGCSMLSCSS
jgi:uncharacterized protein YdiU (UPF0061 family)